MFLKHVFGSNLGMQYDEGVVYTVFTKRARELAQKYFSIDAFFQRLFIDRGKCARYELFLCCYPNQRLHSPNMHLQSWVFNPEEHLKVYLKSFIHMQLTPHYQRFIEAKLDSILTDALEMLS